ncbi:hypothetical protein [Streptomyces sp. NPDC058252]|uniref:hypothetical protein n=1 Tax=Streptomyces sp. NPDC058252 TaxID=3346405 RepID=UPI0036EECC0F
MAAGRRSVAAGRRSVAAGRRSVAAGRRSVAAGRRPVATRGCSVAPGRRAETTPLGWRRVSRRPRGLGRYGRHGHTVKSRLEPVMARPLRGS